MWGVPQPTAPTCMLILAVDAGESGGKPELSRNGVPVCAGPKPGPVPCESENLPAVRPDRPARVPRRPGLAEKAGGRGPPCPGERPRTAPPAPSRARESTP
ncbi:hypothetical protein SCWH03_38850 [Streptomyces pacificus]|uniref:Uncharacterized protein n=1 Tax=Streptomyces pacificus TaxID=2705029 RepID=A0A6A0B1E5_9ACTN|nr:hypothetical protein SCWH03_38850 [Streptomyces pacificus]